MKRKLLVVLLTVAMVSTMVLGCGAKTEKKETKQATTKEEKKGDKGEKYKITLITIDSMDQHWVNMDMGCKKAAKELGNVDYQWLAPDVKDDAKQIECINNAVASGADAILLAANGPDAVTAALKEAEDAGVKLVQVDSFANYDCIQKLGTDNRAAGKMAGEQVLNKLKADKVSSGDIGVISVNAATTSTVEREEGFRQAFEGTKFKILQTQYGEGDAAKSKDIAANFITQGVVALFGANEGSTVGVGNAVRENEGKIVAAGMDKSDAVTELIKEGYLICTMAQNPDVMGAEGIKAAVKGIMGESVTPAYVDTGVSVLDAAAVK